MRADIKVFAINAASRKTIILHCKYIETLYLYLNISVEEVSNRTSFSCKTLCGIIKKPPRHNMTPVNRHISFYQKHGDKYVGEITLNRVDLSDLLSLITLDKYKDDYLLYNCYLLDKIMLDKIASLDNQVFALDLDKYEYYLEATAK